ncbi:hypothetical protein SAMN04488074_12586 [Lentzea albidocapillata subsp. violacea]|uniref:Uncharacterized protein n=1 Tax=Lentzea albidocapillata subsp. violacea TaxID=128104 RepID=A0A1G9VCJ9_9PSEU|nr:hypothetical protein SAMN04488074_12586 [Lentzea albidocapillata subsp. violacea]
MIRACALMDLPPGEAVRIVGPRAPSAASACPVHVKDGGVYLDAQVNRDVA